MYTERPMTELMGEIEFLDDFDQVCRYGFATYRAYSPEVLLEHDGRAAAACIYAHMAMEAERRLLRHHPRIEPIDPKTPGGLRTWRIGEIAVIRFKKQDEDGKSRNYPTKQAKDYDRGDDLPGIPPPAARLSVGYFLDQTGTEFIRTQIARPRSRTVDWCAAIVPEAERRSGSPTWRDVTRQGFL
jgi:hypothetical protein